MSVLKHLKTLQHVLIFSDHLQEPTSSLKIIRKDRNMLERF